MRIRNVLQEFEAQVYPIQPESEIEGKSEWKHYGDGTYRFKLSIRNVALPDGRTIDVCLDGTLMMRLMVQNGKAKIDIEKDSQAGIPVITAGQIVQIKSGQMVLAKGKYEAE